MLRYYIIILFLIFTVPITCQVADTTTNIEHFYLKKRDTSNVKLSGNNNNHDFYKEKSDAFYDSLNIRAQHKKWTSELHDLIFVKAKEAAAENKDKSMDRVSYFEQFDKKYIHKIKIVQVDVFGPTINDTSLKAKRWSDKLGNSLHISTSKWTIKKNLFIAENERIDPYLMSDNERILRAMPNLQDARIIITPSPASADSANVTILTKDVWPVALGIDLLAPEYGKIGVWNNNFLGLGHYFNFTENYNLNREPKFGYRATYKIPNIGHTFTSLELNHYDDIWKNKINRVALSRNFVTPEIRYGGGVMYEKVNQTKSILTYDTTLSNINSEFEHYDVWSGYSVPLKRVLNFKLRKSFFVTTRLRQYQFFIRPGVDTFYLHDFQNRRLFLLSAGWVWQGYQNTTLVYGFGNTEDLPFGSMVKFTAGKEFGEFTNRDYFSLTIAVSKYLNRYGYFSHNLEFGSYYSSKMEQGALNYKFLYFSPTFGNDRHIFRQFAKIQYIQGYNRFKDEFLQIRQQDGIRGLDYTDIKGDKRLFVSSELVYYSPQYLYGFRFVYFLFFDGGLINYKSDILFNNEMFSSVGIGVRIRNERLVFNTIQFRACVFPFSNDVPFKDKHYLDLISVQKTRLPEFADKIPAIVPY